MPSSKGLLLHLAAKLAPEARSRVAGRPESCGWWFGVLRAQQFHRSAKACDVGSKEEGGASSSSGDSPLATRGPYASRLGSRGVLRFDGEDTVKFLQGLVTNDLSRFGREPPKAPSPQPTPNQASAHHPPVYAALLNPQGRFLYDLFLYRPTHYEEKLDRTGSGPADGEDDKPDLLADVDAETLDELVSHLKRHRLRAKVDIQNVSQDMVAWQRYGGTLGKDSDSELSEAGGIGWGASHDTTGQIAAESNSMAWRWWKDPRLDILGLRGIFPSNTTPPLVDADQEVELRYYQLWRLEQGVPEGPKEIPHGEAIPLEYNLDALNAISFDKGCYVGQELIARTHHRGVIRKRTMPVNFLKENGEEAQQDVSEGADVVDISSHKQLGKITTVLGPRGLGLIRLEALQKGAQLGIENTDIHVKAVRPKWWPQEWGHEEYPPRAVSSA